MEFPRASGILLHPTSLPGKYGIGDLGVHAYRFVDYLAELGQTYWQVLPLGPTSYGDSPYQALSTFAGNTNLISFDKLLADGWLTPEDLEDLPDFPVYRVDYGWVIDYHSKKLTIAADRFRESDDKKAQQAYETWCDEQAHWLDDYSLFVALKNENDKKAWVEWENQDEVLYKEPALKAARKRLADKIAAIKFQQWQFFKQWQELHAYANSKGISIIGDIPIFVAHDSSDVWSNRKYFYLEPDGNPSIVAGVPPDYFSPTGQYWGNPLYRWDVMKDEGYQWWIDRLQSVLTLVDVVRIDHFRAFEDYWETQVNEERTAINGRWVKGPNVDFFKVIKEKLGDLPIIAEDLGDITQAVIDLRNKLGLPGMKIIQFAWSGPDNQFLPQNYESTDFVVYTGTHDNNTALGWWLNEGTPSEKNFLQTYLDREVRQPNWEMIRLGMMSNAHTFIAPLQDIFGFGEDTRMNSPGKEVGNWQWRFSEDWLFNEESRKRFIHYTHLYNRWRGDTSDDSKES